MAVTNDARRQAGDDLQWFEKRLLLVKTRFKRCAQVMAA